MLFTRLNTVPGMVAWPPFVPPRDTGAPGVAATAVLSSSLLLSTWAVYATLLSPRAWRVVIMGPVAVIHRQGH